MDAGQGNFSAVVCEHWYANVNFTHLDHDADLIVFRMLGFVKIGL